VCLKSGLSRNSTDSHHVIRKFMSRHPTGVILSGGLPESKDLVASEDEFGE
jgi:hypothetical protein